MKTLNISSIINTSSIARQKVRLRVRTYEVFPNKVRLVHEWLNPDIYPEAKTHHSDLMLPKPDLKLAAQEAPKVASPSQVKKIRAKKMRGATVTMEAASKLDSPDRTFLTVKQTAHRFPIFTEAALRYLIFNAGGSKKRPRLSTSGFETVIFRIPGQNRVLLCEKSLIAWIQSSRDNKQG